MRSEISPQLESILASIGKPASHVGQETPIPVSEQELIELNNRIGLVALNSCFAEDPSNLADTERAETDWVDIVHPNISKIKLVMYTDEDDPGGFIRQVDLLGRRLGNDPTRVINLGMFNLKNGFIFLREVEDGQSVYKLIDTEKGGQHITTAQRILGVVMKSFLSDDHLKEFQAQWSL
jgi:hypothetical protein